MTQFIERACLFVVLTLLAGCSTVNPKPKPPVPPPNPNFTSAACLGAPLAAAVDCSCYSGNVVVPCN